MEGKLHEIVQIEEIKRLKAKYCRFADTKNWAHFQALFTDDATLDIRAALTVNPEESDDLFASEGFLQGREQIKEWVTGSSQGITTLVHHCHTPEIELLSSTQAEGIWAMEDRLQFVEGGPIKGVHAFGHYHETYRLTHEGWRISSVKLTRTRVDLLK